MKKSLLMILFSVASIYAQDSAAPNQAQTAKTTADAKTAKTTKSAKSTRTTAPTPASQPTSVTASSIPKDAEPLGHGRYRAVDANGVAWIYLSTPFGITSKTRESELQQQTAGQSSPFGAQMHTREADSTSEESPTASTVTAFPNGDEIRFEKQTPFGKSGWTKKRTDQLTSVEKTALANAEKATAANGKN